MTVDIDELVTDCPNRRCTGHLVEALVIGPTSNKPVQLDPRPTTWADGGRYRIRQHQPDPPRGEARRVHVDELRIPGQAFGTVLLYQKHIWVCGGGSGAKTRSREADG